MRAVFRLFLFLFAGSLAATAAECVFKTGSILGRDSVTGYDFTDLGKLTGFEGASLGALGTIPDFIDFVITDGGGQGGVPSTQCFTTVADAPHNTRACNTLDFMTAPHFTQAYVKYRMKLHPAFADARMETPIEKFPDGFAEAREQLAIKAAGALAAFCLDRKLTPRQVRKTAQHLTDFQRELERQGVELDWPRMETARSYYSHHNLELKDADTFYFGEASRLK